MQQQRLVCRRKTIRIHFMEMESFSSTSVTHTRPPETSASYWKQLSVSVNGKSENFRRKNFSPTFGTGYFDS
jgi:hypothetical protein